MTTANLRTPLYDVHVAAGGRMVPFGGWEMPVQYPAGILAEVRAVRGGAGVFDVSHMGRALVSGPAAAAFLDRAVTAAAASLPVGRARYGLICNDGGGVIDDTIFYRLPAADNGDDRYLLIPNAGNRHRVLDWFGQVIGDRFPAAGDSFAAGVTINDQTMQTSLLACQGPDALSIARRLADDGLAGLRPFGWAQTRLRDCGAASGAGVLVGRTGYTGEDGVEIMAPAAAARALWQSLTDAGAVPCGLGARDVLRMEAGLPLHGHELTPEITPIAAGLERFVRRDGAFNGADVLDHQRVYGTARRLVGLTLPGRSAPRADYEVLAGGNVVGAVSSGTYSPTLEYCIAMAFVDAAHAAPGTALQVDIRGRVADAAVAELPFYRRSA